MKVEISTRHGQLTAEQQSGIREKAEKLLHYFERLTFIEVTADLQHADACVEVIAKCEHKHDFIGRAEAADPLSAMGAAVAKVKTQIGHYKQKLQDHRHDPSHAGAEGVRP